MTKELEYLCDRPNGCVCGGDTPGVRQGCTHFVRDLHAEARASGLAAHGLTEGDLRPAAMNPWHPMTDPVDLKTAGKALEELGECTAALSRCLIQGMDGVNPDGGQVNRQWLENEMDDVRAQLFLLTERFKLRSDANRIDRKIKNCRDWHKMA